MKNFSAFALWALVSCTLIAQTVDIDFCPVIPPAGTPGDMIRIPIIIDEVNPDLVIRSAILLFEFDGDELEVVELFSDSMFISDEGSDRVGIHYFSQLPASDPNSGLRDLAPGDTLFVLEMTQLSNEVTNFSLIPSTETIIGPRLTFDGATDYITFSSCGEVRYDAIFTESVDVCLTTFNDSPPIGDTSFVNIETEGFKYITRYNHSFTFNDQEYELIQEFDEYANGMSVFSPQGVSQINLQFPPTIYGLILEDNASLITLKFRATSPNAGPLAFQLAPTAIMLENILGDINSISFCDGAPVLTLYNFQAFLYGDTLNNCQVPLDSSSLSGWYISMTEQSTQDNYLIGTNQLGFARGLIPAGTYEYFWVSPGNPLIWEECSAGLVEISDTVLTTIHNVVNRVSSCFDTRINISSSNLRPCFTNNTIFVEYSNYGSVFAPSSFIDLTLDAAFIPLNSSLPYTEVGEGIYRFIIGNLAIGETGAIIITGQINCDYPIGNTLCATAIIYPNKDCEVDPPGFEGGEVELNSNCDGDSVRFVATNIGDGPTGPIAYEAVKDGALEENGSVNFQPGESQSFVYPANGSTWRLEFERPTAAPYLTHALSIVEGCDGDGGSTSTGWVTAFSLLDFDPYFDRYCLQTTGSYDPNDKTATPFGYGPDHFIYPDGMIDYRIRFQNTGTDTAFTVVVRDTIDPDLLDMSTFRAGISSHDYNLTVANGNELTWTFNNILLVDSFTNEPGSNGFLHYEIAQQPDLQDFTEIDTRAGIYFDFNEVVLTEYSELTVARNFLPSQTKSFNLKGEPIQLFPNPANEIIQFSRKDWPGILDITIYDQLGRPLLDKTLNVSGQTIDLSSLTNGNYWYRISQKNRILQTGSFIRE